MGPLPQLYPVCKAFAQIPRLLQKHVYYMPKKGNNSRVSLGRIVFRYFRKGSGPFRTSTLERF